MSIDFRGISSPPGDGSGIPRFYWQQLRSVCAVPFFCIFRMVCCPRKMNSCHLLGMLSAPCSISTSLRTYRDLRHVYQTPDSRWWSGWQRSWWARRSFWCHGFWCMSHQQKTHPPLQKIYCKILNFQGSCRGSNIENTMFWPQHHVMDITEKI